MPAGVVVDADTGVLAIPQLFEPQLYAVHLVAELGDGAAAAVDFYLSVVSGAGSAGGVNDPPVLTPVRVSIYRYRLSIDRSIDRSIDLSVDLSIYLSIYLSVCLSIYLSTSVSIPVYL